MTLWSPSCTELKIYFSSSWKLKIFYLFKCCLWKFNVKSSVVLWTLCRRLCHGFRITNFHFGCYFVFLNQWWALLSPIWLPVKLVLQMFVPPSPPSSAWLPVLCMVVSVVVVLSPLKMAFLHFLLSLWCCTRDVSLPSFICADPFSWPQNCR